MNIQEGGIPISLQREFQRQYDVPARGSFMFCLQSAPLSLSVFYHKADEQTQAVFISLSCILLGFAFFLKKFYNGYADLQKNEKDYDIKHMIVNWHTTPKEKLTFIHTQNSNFQQEC